MKYEVQMVRGISKIKDKISLINVVVYVFYCVQLSVVAVVSLISIPRAPRVSVMQISTKTKLGSI